jgi:hypothetical protein
VARLDGGVDLFGEFADGGVGGVAGGGGLRNGQVFGEPVGADVASGGEQPLSPVGSFGQFAGLQVEGGELSHAEGAGSGVADRVEQVYGSAESQLGAGADFRCD